MALSEHCAALSLLNVFKYTHQILTSYCYIGYMVEIEVYLLLL